MKGLLLLQGALFIVARTTYGVSMDDDGEVDMFDENEKDPVSDIKVNVAPQFMLPKKITYSPMQIKSPDEIAKQTIKILMGQIQMQEFRLEEQTRLKGGSGIEQIRDTSSGSRNYHFNSHQGRGGVGSIHNHANNIRTVGVGEFAAVMNGVEFRTRHNDYRLNMPHRTSSEYHAYEEIPLPEVPPQVTSKTDVNQQIAEMREWFKAWKDQDYSVRDYRKYFKPILCYLEGAWTMSDGYIEESFDSDRHFLDAKTWHDLYEKIRFNAASGRKSALENFAFLPVKIATLNNESVPVLAQWNYRMMCMPLKDDLPLNRFRIVDDLKSRMASGKSLEEYENSRSARFQLNPFDNDDEDKEGFSRYGLLDKLMRQIPGKDNQMANLTDNAYDTIALNAAPDISSEFLNAGYYHRKYKAYNKGAMGSQSRRRGFADANMFVALNTQEKIAESSVTECKGKGKKEVCKTYKQRYSYAFPFEIIIMTPLSKWNPYGLALKGKQRSEEGETVTADGRNGRNAAKALNGTHEKLHFLTPCEFYTGGEIEKSAADTTGSALYVLDQTGSAKKVCASGTRILFPPIKELGILRQRYPIMPVHGEDSPVWKELEALQDIVLEPNRYAHMLREKPSCNCNGSATPPASGLELRTGLSTSNMTLPHSHTIALGADDVRALKAGQSVLKTTTLNNAHSHSILINYKLKSNRYRIKMCDNKSACWDGHPRKLMVV